MYQNRGGLQRGRINSRKFTPFVSEENVVLDFGCGNGALLLHIKCRRKIGVEVNPIAYEEARRSGLEVYESLEKVPTELVDVVISNHTLEHVPCPLQSLRKIYEILIHGGKIVLCVPIDDWRNQKRPNSEDINHHLHTWTPLLLGNLLVEAGYEIDDVWIYHHAWPPNHWQQLDAHLPIWIFDWICGLTAWWYKRRQIMALATKK